MVKKYNLDPGFVTIPEANEIVLRILSVYDKNDKSHYTKILNGAKKGLFGGKKHGSRMYQVNRDEIIQYAEESLRNEKFNLFNIELHADTKEISKLSSLSDLDKNTGTKLHYYLKYLRFHEIISDDVYQNGEKKIILRLKMEKINRG